VAGCWLRVVATTPATGAGEGLSLLWEDMGYYISATSVIRTWLCVMLVTELLCAQLVAMLPRHAGLPSSRLFPTTAGDYGQEAVQW
jgi:hypothetical protein